MTKENAQPQTTASSKTCTKCKETKSTKEFYKDKSRKDGLSSHCKSCDRAKTAKYRTEHHEKYLARRRKYYAENPEKQLKYSRKYIAENPEKEKERHRKYREANPDKIHARTQEALAKRSRRVARIRKMMAHFDGRTGWLEKLAGAIAMRSDAQGLCWIAADIDELLLIHFYKEV